MDRWVVIRSQVHDVALHPYVPGKSLSVLLALTWIDCIEKAYSVTTSESYVSLPQNVSGVVESKNVVTH